MRRRWFILLIGMGIVGGSCSGDTRPAPPVRARTAALTALGSDQAVDARLLLIAADGSSPGLEAARRALAFQGTPYDEILTASAAAITADTLAAGGHGKYQGIVLADDQLPLAPGEKSAIEAYLAQFQLRRAVLSGWPSAEYGMEPAAAASAGATGTWTAAASAVFGDVALDKPLALSGLGLRPSRIVDTGACTPLLNVGDGAIAVLHKAPDGRETLVLTFDQSSWTTTTKQIMPSVLSWVAHDLYLGERRVYFGAQLDDLFRSTPLYGSDVEYRMTPADLAGLLAWLDRLHQSTVTGRVTVSFAANAFWSKNDGSDPLTEAIKQASGKLELINHTWDHTNLDGLTYDQTLSEIRDSDAALLQLGFSPYSTASLITPEVSGLKDANAMRAMADAGVRYIVTDTSRPGENNPTPNTGFWNPLQPSIFMIPRRPTELYYNVSTPAEWSAEYAVIHPSSGPALTAQQIVESESDRLVEYMIDGEMDPWMFHQADARAYAPDHSLISDLLGAALDKYTRLLSLPVDCPPMDVLGKRMADRTASEGAAVTATIGPGPQLTLRAARHAVVPVTGLACAAAGELYGNRLILRVTVEPGQDVTVPFDDGSCNAGPGRDANAETGPQTVPADAGGDVQPPPVEHHSDGGCSTSGTTVPHATAGLLLLLAALWLLRRRRGG